MEIDPVFRYESDDAISLDPRELKVTEKEYLAKKLISGEAKAKLFVNKYKLHKRTLSHYKNRFKKCLRIRERNGRPPIIDEDVQLLLIQELTLRPEMPEEELRRLIRQKHKDCWQKWNGNKPNKIYKRISIRTVGRYSRSLRSRAQLQENIAPTEEILAEELHSTCIIS